MLVTLLGIVTPVRLEQPENAEIPMVCTWSPRVMFRRFFIPEKSEPTLIMSIVNVVRTGTARKGTAPDEGDAIANREACEAGAPGK